MIDTEFVILFPNGRRENRVAQLADEPGFEALDALIRPLIGGGDIEHVWVRTDGEDGVGRTSMFVDDCGHLKGCPRNEEATDLYRRAHMARHPSTDPETLPCIVGVAVVFERRVWF
jgi:hypothetical protein